MRRVGDSNIAKPTNIGVNVRPQIDAMNDIATMLPNCNINEY